MKPFMIDFAADVILNACRLLHMLPLAIIQARCVGGGLHPWNDAWEVGCTQGIMRGWWAAPME